MRRQHPATHRRGRETEIKFYVLAFFVVRDYDIYIIEVVNTKSMADIL